MDDPGLVVHARRLLFMKTGGIVPGPEDFLLLFFDNAVSADGNVSGWDTLFLPFLVVPEPAGMLIANRDGVSEGFGINGEGRTRPRSRLPTRLVPVDHLVNIRSRSVFVICVPHQTCDAWPLPLGHRW